MHSAASDVLIERRALRVRTLLVVFAACTLIELIASIVYAHLGDGTFGIVTTNQESAFRDVVGPVVPGFDAARAGLRMGDVVDLRTLPPAQRFRWRFGWPVRGDTYHLSIARQHHARATALVAGRSVNDDPGWLDIRALFYVRFFGNVVMLGVAALIVLRRPRDRDVRFLSLLLITITFGDSISVQSAWETPWTGLDAFVYCAGTFVDKLGLALLAVYALRFGMPVSRLRRACTVLTFALAAAAGTADVIGIAGTWFGVLDPTFGLLATPGVVLVLGIGPYVAPLVCAVLAIHAARGTGRTKIVWATGALALLYIGPVVQTIILASGGDGTLAWSFRNVPYFVAPLGVTYALLGRRLLDIGFALNRAAVFTGVSIVVLGTFTLAEWALGGYLQSASKSANVVVSAVLALGLGLSIHPIHQRVDRFVDGVFFRKRHEAEQALRAFAREAAFITDAATIVERAQAVLERSTGCAWSDVALYDGVAYYGETPENDPALVAMRASHEIVQLRSVTSAFRGELAFPMSARGRLIGALIVGPKEFGDPYAPDEIAAIGVMAHGTGLALDVATAATAKSGHALLAEIRALRTTCDESNRAIAVALDGLRAAIVERESADSRRL